MPDTATLLADAPQDTDDSQGIVALLDENTANRIAAGEVIERPSSVVKELVENSLDAGATRIEVELIEGGKRRIIVRDDGFGMTQGDAVLALQRHATSKIRDADDLFSIRTLGFRGEALPSIASVSDFHLVTKRPGDDAATEVVVRAGEIVRVEPVGAPNGTQITVENLFASVPARLKFLKTTQTELTHAIELLHRLSLAYHEVAFRLLHDGFEMYAYPGARDPLHAVAAVWGRDVARAMVPISYESPGLSVRGFVSRPSVSRATRAAQATFVNNRFVRSRTIAHAFDAAFRHLMTTERHPVCTLFVDIAPHLVDVNVHPAKTEVRFTRDGDVYSAVHRAVQNALLTGGLVPEVNVQPSLPSSVAGDARPEPVSPIMARAALSSWTQSEVAMPPAGSEAPPAPNSGGAGEENDAGALLHTNEAAENANSGSPRIGGGGGLGVAGAPDAYPGFDGERIGRLRVLGQSRNTYIVCETDDALLLVDQHIAHERVLYEQMMNAAMGESENESGAAARWGVVAQHLALPQTLELGAREARVAAERLPALARAGFVLEPFGGETFVVRAVPARIAQGDYLGTLREILDEMTTATLSRRLLVPHETAVIMASCKMAVKKGDPLTHNEMTRLLGDLARMKNPFTCPHGRPILLRLPFGEMDRKFHRLGPH